ncbi:DUF565 domain-containing protein [Planktothrix sp. FACHB-1355]|uniref:DUF565 domain-containing protein n=1 Tax=Aerosakkonema funiforme FACHB-1375 TaxID=2949571 RepID=A0A926VJV5_9CYAN|nr:MULTISPECIES: DUF565 domain-containing protein [Oscillatoriales]MBD2185053.1 DUF565 domain-containing protein [Aerosakkonema funiforme FACHB-1375]MBD3558353.1 DUF565 domain-containing protein [Planktothrix sp. FACHB-1355]
MQNTRLNNLANILASQLSSWFGNPWRRLSLMTISLLFGVFLGTAIPTTAGQAADWDIIGAGLLVLFTELASRIFYGTKWQGGSRSLLAQMLNALKIGLIYSLFIEAFKLGS